MSAGVENGQRLSLALLFAAGTLNLFDRQVINVLGQQIKVELAISDAQLGLLTGTAFGLLYSVAIVPIARVADRTNRVRVIATALTLWSVCTGLCGLAANFVQLFIARMGVGMSEAGCQPASVSLVRDLFPPNRRTSATAILLAGAPFGACLGLLFGGYLGTHWGWRFALIAATAPGLLVAAIMFLLMREPQTQKARVLETESLRGVAKTLLGRWSLLWLTVAFGCQTFCLFATAAWLPPFFIRAHHMTALQAGGLLGLAVGFGGATGALGVGFLCDLFRRMGTPRDWMLIKIAMVANLPLTMLTILSPSLPLALIGMIALSITVYGYLGPIPVLIQQQATANTRALSLGGVTAVSNIVSMCVGVPAVGLLSDALQPRFGAPAVGYALSIMIGAAAFIGFVALSQAEKFAVDPSAEPGLAGVVA